MAYIPIFSEKLKISYTVPLLFLGMAIYYMNVPVDWPKPFWEHKWVKVITEFIVIISLMGAGLKIGLQYSFKQWMRPLRLVGITMPFYILIIFFLAYYIGCFSGPSSLLLAAVLSPTDPVLASDFQLGNPEKQAGKNAGMRYLLTAEAGLNDGMAFPFVYLAILWQDASNFGEVNMTEWIGFYGIYKVFIGALIGAGIGWLYSYSLKKLHTNNHDKILSGFVAAGLAIASFSIAELCQSYGFLSVFFTGLLAQYHHHKEDEEHDKSELLLFSEETEKLLITLWCLIFGGFLLTGFLSSLTAAHVLIAILAILIVRPISGLLGLVGTTYKIKKKLAISFYGVKGIGSFFYLTYALNKANFESEVQLYGLVSAVVLVSIVVHGLTGPRVVEYFKKRDPG